MIAAALSNSDLDTILLILAILSVVVALYCGYIRNFPGAVIAIVVALILLVIAL